MSEIKFTIAAKTDVGLVRTNNEDNFQASSDLSSPKMRWINNDVCSLGEKGALLVVADGMGGMNAGEVASELAIETVKEFFSPEQLTDEVLKSRFTIEKYMNDAIVAADSRIKSEAAARPETRGMGTTIVIGWVLKGKLYVSWCGDSRAYIYNPAAGLHQITKDHSYVQSLVDKGSITREEAFDFPDSNVITRCLSDGSMKAKPESLHKPYDICDNDIIMLCTDGLCGMIRDEEIEAVIRNNEHDMDALVDDLIQAACNAEGADNITICLCKILEGGQESDPAAFAETERRLNGKNGSPIVSTIINGGEEPDPSKRKFWIAGIVCVLIAIAVGACWWLTSGSDDKGSTVEQQNSNDSLIVKTSPEPEKTVPEKIEPQESAKPQETAKPKVSPAKTKDSGSDKGSIFDKPDKSKIDEPKEAVEGTADGEDELTPVGTAEGSQTTTDELTVSTQSYTVKKGDTYYSLAKTFNTTQKELQRLNKNVALKAGSVIVVPKR